MTEKKTHLKREIGLWGLSANLVNIMVGAGIFALPAIVAAGLGSASIYAYLFCGLLIALVMLCFAEVGSKITTSGGSYTYIQSTFGPYFGLITAVLFLMAAIAADAAVAHAIADILGSIFPLFQSKPIRIFLFLAIFTILGYINIRGVKNGVNLVKLITFAKIAPLILLVMFSWGEVTLTNLAIESSPSIVEIGKISLILFFAFQGGEGGLSVSGEVKNPNKTIPRAIGIGILCVLVLYILIQTVSQGVLGDSLATIKENPLGEVASQVVGPIGFMLITIGAGVSMFGNLSSEILSMPRVLFQAAKDETLPLKKLANIHPKFATPYVSIIVYASLGFIFAIVGGFEKLAILSSASILLVYLGVSLAVIKMRRMPQWKSETAGFKIPGGYTVPILAALIIVWLLSNLTGSEFIGIGLLIVLLTILYFLKKWFRK